MLRNLKFSEEETYVNRQRGTSFVTGPLTEGWGMARKLTFDYDSVHTEAFMYVIQEKGGRFRQVILPGRH